MWTDFNWKKKPLQNTYTVLKIRQIYFQKKPVYKKFSTRAFKNKKLFELRNLLL